MSAYFQQTEGDSSCQHLSSSVTDSRATNHMGVSAIRRVRKCACGAKFRTYEYLVHDQAVQARFFSNQVFKLVDSLDDILPIIGELKKFRMESIDEI